MGFRRLRNWRRLIFALIAFVGAGLIAMPDPGYLARVGPAPLRFFVLPVLMTNHVAKPPPPKPEPKPEKVAEIAPPKVVAPTPPPAAPVTNVPVNFEELPKPSTLSTAPAESVVSPQMFMKFFGRPTNAAPPVDPNSNKSSATYNIGP